MCQCERCFVTFSYKSMMVLILGNFVFVMKLLMHVFGIFCLMNIAFYIHSMHFENMFFYSVVLILLFFYSFNSRHYLE